MAIKVSSATVITDDRKIGSDVGLSKIEDSVLRDFHPNVESANAGSTYSIDFEKAFHKVTLTQNTAFSATNGADGYQITLLIDTSASAYTPTWASDIIFPTSITWSSNRYWTVTLVYWTDNNIRATALGFDAISTPSSSFSNFSLGFTGANWDPVENSYGSGTPAAWAYVSFLHNAANNRVTVVAGSGNSRDGTTQNTTYANYTGLTGISSVEVQYNVQSQSCDGDRCGSTSSQSYGPLPSDDGLNSGTYYNCASSQVFFGWSCESTSNDGVNSQVQANFNSLGSPDFRIKIVCNEGTFYSTAESPANVNLFTNFGPTAGFGGGGGGI
jgi:hypothetical protein